MKPIAILVSGLIGGFIIAQQLASASAQSNQPGDFQMFVTSGSAGGPFAYLLNVRTGVVRFCNAARGCAPVPDSN
jgi:hypothetical protein